MDQILFNGALSETESDAQSENQSETSSEAQPDAIKSLIDKIKGAFQSPTNFLFGDLLDDPVVKQLQGTENERYYEALYLFTYGDYRVLQYVEEQPERLPPMSGAMITKLRQLSLVVMSRCRRYIPFDLIKEKFEFDKPHQYSLFDVKTLLKGAMESNVISGKIDCINERFVVERAEYPRTVIDNDITNVKNDVKQALESPTDFLLGDLLDYPNIKAMKGTTGQKYLETLHLFAYLDYGEYISNQQQFLELSPEMITKLRQLTIASIGRFRRCIPYELLKEKLGIIDTDELEQLIISAIEVNVVKGSLDQEKRQLMILRNNGFGLAEVKTVSSLGGNRKRNQVETSYPVPRTYSRDSICQENLANFDNNETSQALESNSLFAFSMKDELDKELQNMQLRDCSFCSRKFVGLFELEEHQRSHLLPWWHRGPQQSKRKSLENANSDDDDDAGNEETAYQCSPCGQFCSSKYQLKEHQGQYLIPPFMCKWNGCRRPEFRSKEEARKHIELCHKVYIYTDHYIAKSPRIFH